MNSSVCILHYLDYVACAVIVDAALVTTGKMIINHKSAFGLMFSKSKIEIVLLILFMIIDTDFILSDGITASLPL